MKEISWAEFEKIEMVVGTIIAVEDFPEARNPSYKVTVDFGEKIGIKKSSAQITKLYTKESLLEKQIIGIINFPRKQIGKFMSEFLITGFVQENDEVVLAVPDIPLKNGIKLS